MVLRNLLIVVFFVLHLLCVQAQTDTVVVFFKDKLLSSFSVSQPEQYLSPRAIQKRSQNQIEIDTIDLPVNSTYLEDLQLSGANILYSLKWFNAAVITYPLTNHNTIFTKAYIDHIDVLMSSTLGGTLSSSNTLTDYANSKNVLDYMDVPYMHQSGYRGNGVLIGIIDSGFEGVDTLSIYKNLRTQNRIVYSYDVADQESDVYNDHLHGTYILSVLAADSSGYYVGVAPDASFVLLRSEISNRELRIEEYNWVKALEIADSCGVDVVNTSLGYNQFDIPHQSYTTNEMDGSTSICAQGSYLAYKKGMILVVSAGNEGNKSWQKITTPGDSPYVITVGSVDYSGTKSDFSSVGPTATGTIKPDVVAIGNTFPCIGPDGNIKITGGTSLSAPMITGLIAGLLQQYPNVSPTVMMELLRRSGSNFQDPNNQIGYGVPTFIRASRTFALHNNGQSIYVYPNPAEVGVTPKLTLPSSKYNVRIYNTSGALMLDNEIESIWGIADLPNEMNQWITGMYLIVIHNGSDVQTIRWVKP
ncbi:MAG: S8 family peptidase [Cytophagaceae bacterium]